LQLKEVVAALEKDPAFAEELARAEFDAIRPGEEVLPVAPELRLDPQRARPDAHPTSRRLPSWLPAIAVLAQDHGLRSGLLAAAATLIIIAFTFLHEPVRRSRSLPERPVGPGWQQRLRSRYTKPAGVPMK
jgi:hypothetical protein